MTVLQFKFDESYDNQIMSVGGWIGNESELRRLESSWQKRIDFENSHSCENQKITRYHATEMNCKAGEFKNWDQVRCLQFSKNLVSILSKRRVGAIAVACDMNAIREAFPGGDEAELKGRTYTLCLKTLMLELAFLMKNCFRGDSVLLVHDHGNWDFQALSAYNMVIDEPEWPDRNLFEGIVPKTGATAVGLQAADMFAYEVFKGIKARTNNPEAAMRGAVKEMQKKDIPLRARWLDLASVRQLYRLMEESGRYPDLHMKGIS